MQFVHAWSVRSGCYVALVRACVVVTLVACGRIAWPDALMMIMRNMVHEGLTNELNVTIV